MRGGVKSWRRQYRGAGAELQQAILGARSAGDCLRRGQNCGRPPLYKLAHILFAADGATKGGGMNDIDFGSGGPIDHYLADLYARIAGEHRRRDRHLHSRARQGRSGALRHRHRDRRRQGLHRRRRRPALHHPVDLEGLHLRPCACRIRPRPAVLSHVGVEPTGEAFNSIVLDDVHNRPFNPMVNAGAMATAELIKGDTPEARIATMLEVLSRYAGRSLTSTRRSSARSRRPVIATAPSPT